MTHFQDLIERLNHFWSEKGCILHQGYDLEVGAGTFNPATFLRSLGPEPYNAAYVEPSRRPTDGRYGENPNRTQHYFQYQVILKPSPPNIQDLYLESLEAIGIQINDHDIRFVHDDWESPSLGAWGLGWEVWIDGMEITQFTYFQSVGGQSLSPITGELTYGLERLALYIQKKDSFFDLSYNEKLTYGDIYTRNEIEFSQYNFEEASVDMWFRHFDDYEKEAKQLIEKKLPLPAYDFVMKASHAFNLLDARGVISVTERTGYIARLRTLSCLIAEAYTASRESLGFPLIKESSCSTSKPSLPHTPHVFTPEIKKDFLLEIGSEELPATFVPIGLANLEKDVKKLLDTYQLDYSSIKTYGTPRRLSILIHDLAAGKPSEIIERKGPPLDRVYDEKNTVSKAGEGFFRSLDLSPPPLQSIRDGKDPVFFVKEIKNTEYLYARLESEALSTCSILENELEKLILNLDFPKKMRWGTLDITYARPLRWVLALYGEDTLSFSLSTLKSGRISFGHRQLSPSAFEVTSASEYIEALRSHHVMVDIQEREESILTQLDSIEKKLQAKASSKQKVLSQVLHLVEWPFLLEAPFNEKFLRAPKEVLISEMVEHQKYFPLEKSDGTLLNYFVITANNTPNETILKGNQKVLSARLSDGVFLYEQDLKHSLDDFNKKLTQVTYQKELGSVFKKVQRIKTNVTILQKHLQIGSLNKAQRAAELCKADLASELVGEFPELQGTIGKYYALAQGEDPEVAEAIDEHWMPRNEKAPLPETQTGLLLSLADKIDNLISCFSIGLKPSSSSDPYALRRQVLGMVKMLITGKYYLPLQVLFKDCFEAFQQEFPSQTLDINTLKDIESFIHNRIKTVFLDFGFSKDEIEASLSKGTPDIYEAYCKVEALKTFKQKDASFPHLLEVFKRAKGQLQNHAPQQFFVEKLQESAENKLHTTLSEIEENIDKSLIKREYDKAYTLIASLQTPLNTFFEEVHILAEDENLKLNRIALLQRVFKLFERLLDFTKIKI